MRSVAAAPHGSVLIHTGDCLDILPTLDADSIDAVITSPPYGLPLARVLRALHRVLVPDGTCWVLLDDAPVLAEGWTGHHSVSLTEPVSFGGWTLGDVTDVGTDERLYRLHPTDQPSRYVAAHLDLTHNDRVVSDLYAPMSAALVTHCLTTSTCLGDLVLDPFCGIGTTGRVCSEWGRSFVGIDIDPMRVALAEAYIARSVTRVIV
jgi:SAM-dependent methyltransferase